MWILCICRPSFTTWRAARFLSVLCFFFHDTATTEIYTLSLHDALPICSSGLTEEPPSEKKSWPSASSLRSSSTCSPGSAGSRSEEHTSELQSRLHLVCRLLLEKKK